MSSIEWTDETWNPTTGCTPVSPGCLNCYAATFAHRGLTPAHRGLTVLRDGRAVFNGTIKLHEDRLAIPLGWKKPRRVFVDSMSDLFHPGVPFDFADRVFAVMALCPQHTFQVLTKRPERMAEYFSTGSMRAGEIQLSGVRWLAGPEKPGEKHEHSTSRTVGADRYLSAMWKDWPLPNVWLGTSIENQDTADERIPHLLKCPAVVRFLSYEPALDEVSLIGPLGLYGHLGIHADGSEFGPNYHKNESRRCDLHWVIAGGESGHGSRPANIEWFRSVRDQCKAAGVAFFMKQLGADPQDLRIAALESIEEMKPEHLNAHGRTIKNTKGGDPSEWPEDLRVRQWPEAAR